jgi:hypothetical protein
MPEPQSTTDLRVLDAMAEEIELYGTTQLPGSLRSYIKTKRGRRVALVLETLASRISALDLEIKRQNITIDGLRSDMQAMTDVGIVAK